MQGLLEGLVQRALWLAAVEREIRGFMAWEKEKTGLAPPGHPPSAFYRQPPVINYFRLFLRFPSLAPGNGGSPTVPEHNAWRKGNGHDFEQP
ncbi:hypothetical protein [Pseudomonas sp. NyZ201]|uniref:hypothetical protein n=1 Tax=Pseudomonas sp. NyZ201 TaxID=3409857 RepID=UPI003CF564F0